MWRSKHLDLKIRSNHRGGCTQVRIRVGAWTCRGGFVARNGTRRSWAMSYRYPGRLVQRNFLSASQTGDARQHFTGLYNIQMGSLDDGFKVNIRYGSA